MLKSIAQEYFVVKTEDFHLKTLAPDLRKKNGGTSKTVNYLNSHYFGP